MDNDGVVVNVISFSEDLNQRFAMVDGKMVREGEFVRAGLQVEKIHDGFSGYESAWQAELHANSCSHFDWDTSDRNPLFYAAKNSIGRAKSRYNPRMY